ncbi:patatin-like protein [Streptomyces poriticola]|uniref:patatin-like protein n=1 Tax=Streptomyces poriticola TaxID=3120506 RepID=UPI002FCE0BF8
MEVVEETRLALVLNGGVSLAVWMGGVTHELDLLRRASRSLHSGVAERVKEEDRACFALWQRVIREAHTRVVVDVVAGTSAGGLNGSFLAAAIGRGTELPDLRGTWQKAAALTGDRLLKDPPYNSLLDGQYFQDEVGRILGAMCGSEREAEPVTLFVTATALDGVPEYVQDSFGGRFQVADHRRIYAFQHDPQAVVFRKTGVHRNAWKPETVSRKDFLDEAVLDRLCLAARASAGFPVAFAPVDESSLLAQRVRPAPEIPSKGRDRASWIVDGGVLNNAPFGPVLDSISDRKVDGPTRRVLVYIVPSSGVTDPHEQSRPPCKSTEWPSVLGTAVTYPREADFRTGTAELQERMNRECFDRHLDLFRCQSADMEKERRTAGPGSSGPRPKGSGCDLVHLARSLFDHYRESRIRGALWKVRQVREEGRGVRSLARIRHEDVNALLALDPKFLWVPDGADALQSCLDLDQPWQWGASVAERLIWTLVGDIEQRLRDSTKSPREEAGSLSRRQAALTSSLGELSYCAKVVRAVQETIFSQIRNASQAGGSPAHRLDPEQGPTEMLNAVYENLGVGEVVRRQVKRAFQAYDKAVYEADTTAPLTPRARRNRRKRINRTLKFCLAAEVVAGAGASPEELTEHTPQFEFLRLGPDEYSPLFPHDKFAPLGDRKLYGVRLNHFGAFVRPEWRASDFAWGRLDASHHLLRLFIPDHEERQRTETEMHEAILLCEKIGKGEMRKNLKRLAEPDDTALFKEYLDSPEGRSTFGRIVEKALSMLISKGAFARNPFAEATKVVFWRSFGRRVRFRRPSRVSSANQLLGLSRPTFSLARWWWWRRIRKHPRKTMGATLVALLLAIASLIGIPFGIAEAVDHFTDHDWRWQTLLLAAPSMLVGGLLILEWPLTALAYFIRSRVRRRRGRRPHRGT